MTTQDVSNDGENLIIFYRDVDGKDAKILGGSRRRDVWDPESNEPRWNGELVSAIADRAVFYLEFDRDPEGWDLRNIHGLALKKIDNGQVVSRTDVDILSDTVEPRTGCSSPVREFALQ